MANATTLDRKHIYILPNRYGVIMGMVLLIMLATSLNYSLSLGFAFTFLLTGVCLVSLFHTYRNLHGLTLTLGQAPPTFAGGQAHFPVRVDNSKGPQRYTLCLAPAGVEQAGQDIAANTQDWLTLTCAAPRRGWLTPGVFHISSTYPLGLVRGWSILRLQGTALVYPAPAEEVPPLPTTRQASGEQGMGRQDGDDFQGLRDYQAGDSIKHIHWKNWARQEQLQVKQFAGQQQTEFMLDFDQLAPQDTEARLSCLCRWVLQADQAGFAWGLRLPGLEIAPASGENHRHACLQALALFDINH